MRTLYLLRHAKSSWKDLSIPDFERPLKKRGREAAELIGRHIRSERINLDLVISSPAVRTRETAELLLKHVAVEVPVRYDQRIYEADLATLLEVVSSAEDDKLAVLVVGHNPGMEQLLEFFTAEILPMPTAAFAKVTFESSTWGEARRAKGRLESYVTPKDLLDG